MRKLNPAQTTVLRHYRGGAFANIDCRVDPALKVCVAVVLTDDLLLGIIIDLLKDVGDSLESVVEVVEGLVAGLDSLLIGLRTSPQAARDAAELLQLNVRGLSYIINDMPDADGGNQSAAVEHIEGLVAALNSLLRGLRTSPQAAGAECLDAGWVGRP